MHPITPSWTINPPLVPKKKKTPDLPKFGAWPWDRWTIAACCYCCQRKRLRRAQRSPQDPHHLQCLVVEMMNDSTLCLGKSKPETMVFTIKFDGGSWICSQQFYEWWNKWLVMIWNVVLISSYIMKNDVMIWCVWRNVWYVICGIWEIINKAYLI